MNADLHGLVGTIGQHESVDYDEGKISLVVCTVVAAIVKDSRVSVYVKDDNGYVKSIWLDDFRFIMEPPTHRIDHKAYDDITF